MANMTVFKQHFDLLEETIGRLKINWLNLKNKAPSIFYCNESLIAMDRKERLSYLERQTKLMLKSKERGTKSS